MSSQPVPHNLFSDMLAARTDADRAAAFRHALGALPAHILPLQQATTQGGLVKPRSMEITVLNTHRADRKWIGRIGVFFIEVVGGCNCHDDPVEANGYCVIEVSLASDNGHVTVRMATD